MAVTFPCPACGQTIGANVAPGTLVRCPLCQQNVQVPGGAGPTGMMPPSISGQPQLFNAPPPFPSGQKAGMAIATLVLGLCTLIPCLFFLAVPAIICGIIALIRVSREPQTYRGRGMAIVGLCIGVIAPILYTALFAAKFPTAMKESCRTNFSQIDRALKQYNKAERNPPQDVDDLVSKNYLLPQFAVCLNGTLMHQVQPSYHVVPGGGSTADPRRITAYEDPRNHGNEGGHVLYADGNVEFLSAAELTEAIDRNDSSRNEDAVEEDSAEAEESSEKDAASTTN